MKDFIKITGVRDEAIGGGPNLFRAEFVFSMATAQKIVREGKIPEAIVDDLILQLMAYAR